MKFRKLIIGAATLGLLAGPIVAVQAAPAKDAPKASGSVALGTGTPSDPYQYTTFNAIGSTPAKGNVEYTNFDLDSTTISGVWDVADWTTITFPPYGSFTLSNLVRTPTSTSSESFAADAVWGPDSSYTATVTGTVSGSTVNFTMVYTGTNPGSTHVGTGSIASDGSMSGTTQGYDASSGQTLPYSWTAPAGSADPAFHFTSPVNCVTFPSANSAVFSATIPADSGGPGSVLGQPYAVKVVDNGEPGTSDTYSHNLGNCTQTAFTGYTVTSGNIQVKR